MGLGPSGHVPARSCTVVIQEVLLKNWFAGLTLRESTRDVRKQCGWDLGEELPDSSPRLKS